LFDNWDNNLATPTYADGDINLDGDLDFDDFDIMFAQMGLRVTAVS